VTEVRHHARLGVSYTAARRVATTRRRDTGGPGRWLTGTRLPPGLSARVGATVATGPATLALPLELVLDRSAGEGVSVFSGEALIEMGADGCALLSVVGALPAGVGAAGLDEGLVLLAVADVFSEAAGLLEREARSIDALFGVPV